MFLHHGPTPSSTPGHPSSQIGHWPATECIPFFCLHVSQSLDRAPTSAYFMKSDRALRIQLTEWEASVLISHVTSLPTPTPFKRTQIYIWIFHKQEHGPSRFVQNAEKCSFDSDPENTSLNGCASETVSTRGLSPNHLVAMKQTTSQRESMNSLIVLTF